MASQPAFGYLRSDLQAIPLVAGRSHTIGRKPELCSGMPKALFVPPKSPLAQCNYTYAPPPRHPFVR